MNRKAANILSGIFFGIFTAPILSIIWFVVPWLRNFPVGDDSPHGVGLPLGFCLGMLAAFALNRRFRWGRAGAIVGAILLVIAIACSAIVYSTMTKIEGLEGLGWLIGFFLCLHGVVSAFGLLLSGFFSHLRAKNPQSSSSPNSCSYSFHLMDVANARTLSQRMRIPKRLILIISVAIVVCLGYTLRKFGWESDFGRPWQVDIEASVSRIDKIPNEFENRFKSLEDYKSHVRELGRGLTLTIHNNGTATLGRRGSSSTDLVWRRDGDFDYWLNTKNTWWLFPAATVGHGYDRISSHTARLKFQLEWSEDVATREFLILRRP